MRNLVFIISAAAFSSACVYESGLIGDGLSNDEDCGEVPCDDPCGAEPCGDSSDDPADDGHDGGAIGGLPTPFALNTASAFRIDDTLNVSLTDGVGLTACGLAEDERLVPGVAATQVFVKVEVETILACPEGVYPLYQCESGGRLDPGCAQYRSWDTQGRLVARRGSVGGVLRVERDPNWECKYEVEVAFPGGVQLGGSFLLPELDVWEEDAVCTR
jgi:hypothetical protein